MGALLTILFIAIFVAALLEEYLGIYKIFLYVSIFIAMVCFTSFRPIGFDRDSPQYEAYFLGSTSSYAESVEPLFKVLAAVTGVFSDDVHLLFFVFAFLSLGIKFYAIRKLSPTLFLPLLIYFGSHYILQDLTQIRAGLAAAFILLAIIDTAEGKRKNAIGWIFLATMSHYSALMMIPILFLSNESLTAKWKYALYGVVPFSFLLYTFDINMLLSLPMPEGVKEKVDAYQTFADFGLFDKNAFITPLIGVKLMVYYFCVFFSEAIEVHIPKINILLKVLGLSFVFYYFFASITIMSQRLSELYEIVQIIIYASFIFTIRPKQLGMLVSMTLGIIFAIYNIFVWELLDFKA